MSHHVDQSQDPMDYRVNHGMPSEGSPFYQLHIHLLDVVNENDIQVSANVLDEALQTAAIVDDDAKDASILSTIPFLVLALQSGKVGSSEFEIVIRLLDKILGRDCVEFERIRNLVHEDAFKKLLVDKSVPARLFALKMIRKAGDVTGGTSWIADEGLMIPMVEQWLRAETEVSTKMEDCLFHLLSRDYKDMGSTGRLWREFFQEANYKVILEICSWKGIEVRDLLDNSRSISQQRLLSLCAKLCQVDTSALISPSRWPELHRRFPMEGRDLGDGSSGLLGYAINLIRRDDSLTYAGLIESAIAMLDAASQCQSGSRGDGPNTDALELLSDFFKRDELLLLEHIFNTYASSKEHVGYNDPYQEENVDVPVVESSHLLQLSAQFIVKYACLFPVGFATDMWYSDAFFRRIVTIERVQNPRDRGDLGRISSMKEVVLVLLGQKLSFPNDRMSKATFILLTGLPIQYFLPEIPETPLHRCLVPMISIRTPGPYPALALAYFFKPPSAPSLGRLFYGLWLAYQRINRDIPFPETFFKLIHSQADQARDIQSCRVAIELWKTFICGEEWKAEPPAFFTKEKIEICLKAVDSKIATTGMGELIYHRKPLEDIIRPPHLPGLGWQHIRAGDPITEHDTDAVKMLKERYHLVEVIYKVLRSHYSNTKAGYYFLPIVNLRLRNGVEGYDQGRAIIPGTDVVALSATQ